MRGAGEGIRDFGLGVAANIPAWSVRTARGFADLATLGRDNPVSRGFTNTLNEYERFLQENAPTSGAFTAGRIGSEFVTTGAEYTLGGGAIRAGIKKALPSLARRTGLGVRSASMLREVGKDALAVLPLDMAMAARREESIAGQAAALLPEGRMQRVAEATASTFPGRVAAEVAFGAAADVGLRSAFRGASMAKGKLTGKQQAQFNSSGFAEGEIVPELQQYQSPFSAPLSEEDYAHVMGWGDETSAPMSRKDDSARSLVLNKAQNKARQAHAAAVRGGDENEIATTLAAHERAARESEEWKRGKKGRRAKLSEYNKARAAFAKPHTAENKEGKKLYEAQLEAGYARDAAADEATKGEAQDQFQAAERAWEEWKEASPDGWRPGPGSWYSDRIWDNRGAVLPEMAATTAGAGLGAAVDEENRLRGAALGAGIGAASIPLLRQIDRMGSSPGHLVNPLIPMDTASRMARADEQFPDKAFHGTRAEFTEIDPDEVDIGLHVGTADQASNRLRAPAVGGSVGVGFEGAEGASTGQIMPLRYDRGKTLELLDVGLWKDSTAVAAELMKHQEVRQHMVGLAAELDELKSTFYADLRLTDWYTSPENRAGLDDLRHALQMAGYDTVKYKNLVENTAGKLTPAGEARVAELNSEETALREVASAAARALTFDEYQKLPGNSLSPDPTQAEMDWALDGWHEARDELVKEAVGEEGLQIRLTEISAKRSAVRRAEQPDQYSYIILDPSNARSGLSAAFDPENIGKPDLRGGVMRESAEAIVGAGVGATVGARADEENRLRGAVVGAGLGAGSASAVRMLAEAGAARLKARPGVVGRIEPTPEVMAEGSKRLHGPTAARLGMAAVGMGAMTSDDRAAQGYGALATGVALGRPVKKGFKFKGDIPLGPTRQPVGALDFASQLEGNIAHFGNRRSLTMPAISWLKALETSTSAGELDWTGTRKYLEGLGTDTVHMDDLNKLLDEQGLRLQEHWTRDARDPTGGGDDYYDPDLQVGGDHGGEIGGGEIPPPGYGQPPTDERTVRTLANLGSPRRHARMRDLARERGYDVPPHERGGMDDWETADRLAYDDEYWNTPGGTDYDEIRITLGRRHLDSPKHTQGHWPEDDVLVHLRLHTRKGPDGKPYTYVDEVQSDLHQEGAKWGYRTDEDNMLYEVRNAEGNIVFVRPTEEGAQAYIDRNAERIRARGKPPVQYTINKHRTQTTPDGDRRLSTGAFIGDATSIDYAYQGALRAQWQEASDEARRLWALTDAETGELTIDSYKSRRPYQEARAEADRLYGLLEQEQDLARSVRQGGEHLSPGDTGYKVPDTPYKGADWVKLGLRRAIDRAIAEGHTRVEWVGGQIPADRAGHYNAANIDHIETTPAEAGAGFYKVKMHTPDGQVQTREFGENRLRFMIGDHATDKIIAGAEQSLSPADALIRDRRNDLQAQMSDLFEQRGAPGRWRVGVPAEQRVSMAEEWNGLKDELAALPDIAEPQPTIIKGSEIQGPAVGMLQHYDETMRNVAQKLGLNVHQTLAEGGKKGRGWAFDIPPEMSTAVREHGSRMYSHQGVTGAILGGMAGSTFDEEDSNAGLLLGAAAGAGMPMIAGRVAKSAKSAAGRALTSMDNRAAARRAAHNLAATSPTQGKGDTEVMSNLDPDGAVHAWAKDTEAVGKKITRVFREDERLLNFFERSRQNIFRSVLSLEKLDELAGEGSEVGQAAGQLRGAAVAAEQYLEDTLKPVLEKHADHLNLGARLLQAKRAIELNDLFPDHIDGDRVDQALEIVGDLGEIEEVKAAAEALHGYYRGILDMKYNEGLLSDQGYGAAVARGESYVPFIPEEVAQLRTHSDGSATYAPVEGALRGMDSDELTSAYVLVNPYEQAIKDTYEAFRQVGRQRVSNIVTGLADTSPEVAKYVTKLPKKPTAPAMYGESFPVIRDGKQVWYHIDDPDLLDSWTSINREVKSGIFMRIAGKSRRFMQAGVTLNPVFMLRNGIRDYFMSAVQTPLNEGVPVLRGIGPAKQLGAGAVGGLLVKDEDDSPIEAAAKGMAAVGAPHMMAHFGRVASALHDVVGPKHSGMVMGGLTGYFLVDEDDSMGSGAFKVAVGAGVVGYHGLGRILPKGDREALARFNRSGAGQFGLYSGKDTDRLLKDMLNNGVNRGDILEPKGWGGAIKMVMAPINALFAKMNAAGRAIETAPRLAHFKRTGDALGSRDLSIDFAVAGSGQLAKFVKTTVPFAGAQLQGVDKLARMMLDPELAPVAAATLIAPSILLWHLNHSDEETAIAYSSRPQWERNSYWLIPKKALSALGLEDDDSGGFYRVPKPFELGYIYGSIPERALDTIAEYDQIGANLTAADAMGEVGDMILDFSGSFMSPSLPLPFGPIALANAGEHGYDIFTRRPIDPLPWLDIPQSEQYTPYTSTVALGVSRLPVVSKIMAAAGFDSPAKIDYAIRAYAGTLGGEAAKLATEWSRSMPEWPVLDPLRDERPPPPARMPYGARDFQTNPQLVTQHETEFRELFGETLEVNNVIRLLSRQDPMRASTMLQDRDTQTKLALYQMGRPFKTRIDDLTAARREIRFSSQLDEETKRRMTIELTVAIAGVSSTYNRARRMMERRMDERQ